MRYAIGLSDNLGVKKTPLPAGVHSTAIQLVGAMEAAGIPKVSPAVAAAAAAGQAN